MTHESLSQGSAAEAAQYIRTTLFELLRLAEIAGYDGIANHLRQAIIHADQEAGGTSVVELKTGE